jgi:hypothetical protein
MEPGFNLDVDGTRIHVYAKAPEEIDKYDQRDMILMIINSIMVEPYGSRSVCLVPLGTWPLTALIDFDFDGALTTSDSPLAASSSLTRSR